jgi:hypothetical protein
MGRAAALKEIKGKLCWKDGIRVTEKVLKLP